MRISDWSSDVCSSDLVNEYIGLRARREQGASAFCGTDVALHAMDLPTEHAQRVQSPIEPSSVSPVNVDSHTLRSEEHTSELQSLMRISYAVFCLKKKKKMQQTKKETQTTINATH